MPHVETAQKYEKLASYPDMRAADREIWEVFIEKNPDRFERVWYDYRVGEHAPEGHICTDCDKTGWFDLCRWAIDAVAEDAANIYIIEIKPHANAKAIGQAICYTKLFAAEHEVQKRLVPVVLTDLEIASTKKSARELGVELWVV
ncbi:MAG: hypothetical protein HY471_03145 [Candidatus Sungbacteria bacterium]|nr:hypothetical protein [Candidatus Sungbacteria bacterium]